jgi:DNA polymerase-3 subunit epsilon
MPNPLILKPFNRAWWNQVKLLSQNFDSIIALDLETTGLDPIHDEIVEVGLVTIKVKDKNVTTQWKRFKPSFPIPPQATRIHKITNEMVQNCPNSSEAVKYIANKCNGKNLIIGYNTHEFDFKFIWESLKKYPDPEEILDTFSPSHSLDLYQIFKAQSPDNMYKFKASLANCYKVFHGGDIPNAHNATADAMACVKMLGSMSNYYKFPKGRAAIKRYMHANGGCLWFMDEKEMFKQEMDIMNRTTL